MYACIWKESKITSSRFVLEKYKRPISARERPPSTVRELDDTQQWKLLAEIIARRARRTAPPVTGPHANSSVQSRDTHARDRKQKQQASDAVGLAVPRAEMRDKIEMDWHTGTEAFPPTGLFSSRIFLPWLPPFKVNKHFLTLFLILTSTLTLNLNWLESIFTFLCLSSVS